MLIADVVFTDFFRDGNEEFVAVLHVFLLFCFVLLETSEKNVIKRYQTNINRETMEGLNKKTRKHMHVKEYRI